MCARYLLQFVCVFVLTVACGGSPTSGEPKALQNNCELSEPKSDDWEYLLFVVQWPQGFCLLFNHSATHHHRSKHHTWIKCIIPSNIRHWTIHGTWPSLNTTWPQNCNPSWTFSLDEINDLIPEMNQSWPNLLVGKPFDTFWIHEWKAHGTCCANLPALRGEHNYFSKTLEFRQKYNIDKTLSVAGIVPSPSARYKLADIQQALRNATGTTHHICCFFLKTSTGYLQYLSEIRLCLNKSLEPRDCPPTTGYSKTNNLNECSAGTEITLPPIQS